MGMPNEKVLADEPQEKVLVSKDALWHAVSYLWDEERKHYIECVENRDCGCVGLPDDDHIFAAILPLAEACEFVESAQKEFEEVLAECDLDDGGNDDDSDAN